MNLLNLFQYEFMTRALVVGTLIGISGALLGVFLVLKHYSMIGDGLAHVSFASVAIALALGATPLLFSLPLVIGASFLIMMLSEKNELHADAAIGLVSSFSVALGIFLSSLRGGFGVDLNSYLFGSILVIRPLEVWISVILGVGVVSAIVFFHTELIVLTYDEDYARTLGLNTRLLNQLLALLTSVTILLGIRVVGTLLISSMIIFPAVTALQLKKSFHMTLFLSVVISLVCMLGGIMSSFVLNTPTGATIVLLNGVVFALVYLSRRVKA